MVRLFLLRAGDGAEVISQWPVGGISVPCGHAKNRGMISLRSRAFFFSALMSGVLSVAATGTQAQGSSSLHGRATDAAGNPLQHAVVQLVSDQTTHGGRAWRYTLMGDSLGKFSQEGLAPGAYLVMLFTDGKGTDILRSIQLRAGDARALDLTLTPTVQMAGTSLMDERRRMRASTK